MITTPYQELRLELEQEDDWQPKWAQRLQINRTEEKTVYIAQPDIIDSEDLLELSTLIAKGWSLSIDSRRLNSVRIAICMHG